jgi:hypothetical protein
MNGRVYDPLLARFGTPDPTTESPFTTQGWNRYSYVGNSPLNFTDPSGYCFLGCFWKPIFRAVGNFLKQSWGSLLQIGAAIACAPAGLSAVCAVAASAFAAGVTSGSLGVALKAGLISAVTAAAFYQVGNLTGDLFGTDQGVLNPKLGGHGPLAFMSEAHAFNIAGHALVGCGSAVASGGKCGPGALAAGLASAASPALDKAFPNARTDAGDLFGGTVASAVIGGVGSVAGGGKFANGAVTAAFGYLFNQMAGGGQGKEERITYVPDPDNAYVMIPEFRAGFAGSNAELDMIKAITEIEAGTRQSYETLRYFDMNLPKVAGWNTFYQIYYVTDSLNPARIANIPGSTTYYYAPYHYVPGPGAPNAWFHFDVVDGCKTRGRC